VIRKALDKNSVIINKQKTIDYNSKMTGSERGQISYERTLYNLRIERKIVLTPFF